MVESDEARSRRPGPHRREGAPAGPEEVRRAVLDAAALLFAERGVDGVSLRQVASAADVHHALIERYIGNRDELIRAVFEDLSRQLGEAFLVSPLSGTGFGLDSVGGRWSRVAASLATTGHVLDSGTAFNPVEALAETIVEAYGLRAPRPGCGPRRSSRPGSAGGCWRSTWSARPGSMTWRWTSCATSWSAPTGASARRRGRRRRTPPRTRTDSPAWDLRLYVAAPAHGDNVDSCPRS